MLSHHHPGLDYDSKKSRRRGECGGKTPRELEVSREKSLGEKTPMEDALKSPRRRTGADVCGDGGIKVLKDRWGACESYLRRQGEYKREGDELVGKSHRRRTEGKKWKLF